jgi:hypothetical protein
MTGISAVMERQIEGVLIVSPPDCQGLHRKTSKRSLCGKTLEN